jgi:hypothetical protein
MLWIPNIFVTQSWEIWSFYGVFWVQHPVRRLHVPPKRRWYFCTWHDATPRKQCKELWEILQIASRQRCWSHGMSSTGSGPTINNSWRTGEGFLESLPLLLISSIQNAEVPLGNAGDMNWELLVIKSRRIRWVGCVACIGEMRNTCEILVKTWKEETTAKS